MSDNASGCVATIVNRSSFSLHRTEMRKWTENGDGNGGPWWEPPPPEVIAPGTRSTFGNGLNAWVNCCGSVSYMLRDGAEDISEFVVFWRITPFISPAPHAVHLHLDDRSKGLVNFYWDPERGSKRLTSGPKPKVTWTLKDWPE